MKYKKLKIGALLVSLLLLVGSLSPLVGFLLHEKLSMENTTELVATVVRIEKIEGAQNNSYIIHTKEYGAKLRILDVNTLVNLSDLNSLSKDQTITIRIQNVWLEQFDEIPFVSIVALKAQERVLFTLENYNDYEMAIFSELIFIGIIVGIFSLVAIVYCILLLKGINVLVKIRDRKRKRA